MTIKDRIIKVLEEKQLTYKHLLQELNLDSSSEITEKDLDKSIEKLDSVILEKISKILRIPLYSFYRKPDDPEIQKIPYYDQDIWKYDKKRKN